MIVETFVVNLKEEGRSFFSVKKWIFC